MKSESGTFDCKYSHKTALIYSQSQEVEKCYITSVSKKNEQQHQAPSTHDELLTVHKQSFAH